MVTENFFKENREQSRVKSEIIEKYFDTWAKIITATQDRQRVRKESRIGYVDLFAGPGRYEDGAISTPLRIIQKAVSDPIYQERLVTIFNDKDEKHARLLQHTIDNFPGIEKLNHKPQVWNQEVGTEIAKTFESVKTIPLLAFIDPWGYKGLSLRLVNAFLKDWGCDCIFFFNYARINAGLSNSKVKEHMAALFGEERAHELKEQLDGMKPADREAMIVNELGMAFKAYGYRFVLPFCFKNESGTRTKHHLILVSKDFKAYDVMKDIMAKYSSEEIQGVPSFAYMPPSNEAQQLLLELNRPIDELQGMLLEGFAGRTVTKREIYVEHSVDRPFLERNYATALLSLEDAGEIEVYRPKGARKRKYGKKTEIKFPETG
jgi:three-Cys-motif partner protein